MTEEVQNEAIDALESGLVVYLPHFPFSLNEKERAFLTPEILGQKAKNVSFDSKTEKLGGTICQGGKREELGKLMKRFAKESSNLIDALFPFYSSNIKLGRTSFRTIEVLGRVTSYKKDDTRLHVDAFPATPVRGRRIMRVFSNVNPSGRPRVWKVGEPFQRVVEKMAPRVLAPFPGSAHLLKLLKITKERRSLYDHYMLKIHDLMKADMEYQKNADQEEVHFPPGATWIVFSDQVSHAALSGQHLFEQTFYLPSHGLFDEQRSPLKILEKFLNKSLI